MKRIPKPSFCIWNSPNCIINNDELKCGTFGCNSKCCFECNNGSRCREYQEEYIKDHLLQFISFKIKALRK